MRLFRKKDTSELYEKEFKEYEHKYYEHLGWVKDSLKGGLMLSLVCFILYIVYKFIVWL